MCKNLDLKCAEYGNKVITEINNPKEKNKIESAITKALGVLQENGLYAFSLYIKSKKGDVTASRLFDNTFALLKDDAIGILSSKTEDLSDSIREELSDDLDKLLFAKDLTEHMLIYARYHAKALEENTMSRDE